MESLPFVSAIGVSDELKSTKPQRIELQHEQAPWELFQAASGIWLGHRFDGRNSFALRMCPFYPPYRAVSLTQTRSGLRLRIKTGIGTVNTELFIRDSAEGHLHYISSLTPARDFIPPETDLEFCFLDKGYDLFAGPVDLQQEDPKNSGVYFSLPESDLAFYYFHDLTPLNQYLNDTQTEVGDLVQVRWPEVGLLRPKGKKPVKKGSKYVLSSGFLLSRPKIS